jgi:hypothetical protein
VDYFLRAERKAMRKPIAKIFDPATRYEYELPLPNDIARALEFDAKFKSLDLGLVDGMVAAVAERRRVYEFSPATSAILAPSALAPTSRALSIFCREIIGYVTTRARYGSPVRVRRRSQRRTNFFTLFPFTSAT